MSNYFFYVVSISLLSLSFHSLQAYFMSLNIVVIAALNSLYVNLNICSSLRVSFHWMSEYGFHFLVSIYLEYVWIVS